jgi:hypothetical protein
LLADGALQEHERTLLARLGQPEDDRARAVLNAYYLSEAGLAALRTLLADGHYRVTVPEEGALLAAAWLLAHGREDQARAVLDEIGPHMGRLRFYPVPHHQPLEESDRVRVQDVGETVAALTAVRTKPVHLQQREALLVWAPLYDRAVELFLETVDDEPPRVRVGRDGVAERRPDGSYVVEGGWPCQRYAEDWPDRARSLLAEYERLRAEHSLCRKPDRANRTFAKLRGYLARCADDPGGLRGLDVARIRQMVAGFAHKRGGPGSARLLRMRAEQTRQAQRPTTAELARVLTDRLGVMASDAGLEDATAALAPIAADEAARHGVPPGHSFPDSLRLKVLRSTDATIEGLVEGGVVTSGEALARLIPQLTGSARAAAIPEPELRRLYGAIYRAFRRRRSLLLLNLRSQVKVQELPWVRPLEEQRINRAGEREPARKELARTVALALGAFPAQILPNKLLQEVRALADAAGLDVPVVDELAADIFMGDFSEKFLRAAQRAAALLEGTLYERYYAIPYAAIRRIDDVRPSQFGAPTSQAFAALCCDRAGESGGRRGLRWSVAANGTIIEQAQILTTHNLAVLFEALDLRERLGGQLEAMARRCMVWTCWRLQTRAGGWTAKLRGVKNGAYAWRQMVFYLSLLPPEAQRSFVARAEEHLAAQTAAFTERFGPALGGLRRAVAGESPPVDNATWPFLGWTTGTHWLLARQDT